MQQATLISVVPELPPEMTPEIFVSIPVLMIGLGSKKVAAVSVLQAFG